MLCEKCQKEQANVHITTIINGEQKEMHLCKNCAATGGFLPLGAMPDLGWQQVIPYIMTPKSPNSGVSCPECGQTYERFSRHDRFGCPTCYTTFGERTDELLKRIHGANRHKGKVPSQKSPSLSPEQQKLLALKKQLDTLVAKEEFEEAAKVRDEIRQLEQQGKVGENQ